MGTAEVVISEYGTDLEPVPEREEIRQAPAAGRLGNPLPGASHSAKAKAKRALPGRAKALRTAATTAHHSDSAIGAYYRRLAANKGSDVAVFATARKLACLIYRMLCRGQAYVDEGVAAYEKRYQAARISRLKATANQLGFKLEPQTSAA